MNFSRGGASYRLQWIDESQVPLGAIRRRDLPQLLGRFSSHLINPNSILTQADITDKQSAARLNIPPGYRAVSIIIDRRTGVDWFARPDSRVDVLCSMVKDGRPLVATIVRFAKILSVGGATKRTEENQAAADNQGQTTITLLTTERDAKLVELARAQGTLSLSLVGEGETVAPTSDPDPVDINNIFGSSETTPPIRPELKEEEDLPGVLYTKDPHTGKEIRYLLTHRGRRWKRDADY